jgi:hypothetical protein
MKTSQILDLQSKLDASEKRNFSLEAQIKEFKLKLEFSESDPRKRGGYMTEDQARKYDRKLDELRAQYEKLLKNVRQEERDVY